MFASHSKQEGHSRTSKVGVIITNLGSPSAPTPKALKRYLHEFLSDPRVVETPRWLWWMILNGVILNFRPRRSAKTYAKIWTKQGSPLSVNMASLTEKLSEELRTPFPSDHILVDYAMRYGSPSIENVVQDMQAQGVQRLIVLPLYPQYSASTTASTFDEFANVFKKLRWQPSLDFLPPYYDQPMYIKKVAESIRQYREQNGAGELLLYSYHGIPQRYLHNGDPYHCQCLKTSRLINEKLGLSSEEAKTVFQSRFGREPWLQPYLDVSLEELAKQGYKHIDVISPGFSIDCLETLEEIQMEARQTFVDAGGETLNYIPCLNDSPLQVELLSSLIKPSLKHHLDQVIYTSKKKLSSEEITQQEKLSPNQKTVTSNEVVPSSK